MDFCDMFNHILQGYVIDVGALLCTDMPGK